MRHDPTGRAWADFHLGAAYEGPPGLVHGGVAALVLDQVLGEAAGAGGKPGMTGTLTLRYRRGTPLGDLHVEAHIDRVDGIKTYAVGHIADAEGVTVEAEGVFILPKWARKAIEGASRRADQVRVGDGLDPGAQRRCSAGTPALAGVGEPRLLQRPGLELRAPGGLEHRARGVVRTRVGDQVGRAALEPSQRRAGEDLLLGGGALGATAAEERDRSSAAAP